MPSDNHRSTAGEGISEEKVGARSRARSDSWAEAEGREETETSSSEQLMGWCRAAHSERRYIKPSK